jgi:predicted nucleotidyltransferase
MKKFATSQLDQIISDRRLKLEEEREEMLRKTQAWLEEFATEYGIEKAYIFGSVTRPGKFHQNSDVDLAVEQIKPEKYCLAISLLSAHLQREVDVIELEKCHFSDRLRQTGILWTKTV